MKVAIVEATPSPFSAGWMRPELRAADLLLLPHAQLEKENRASDKK